MTVEIETIPPLVIVLTLILLLVSVWIGFLTAIWVVEWLFSLLPQYEYPVY